jgi:hypothetical protein
MAGTQQGTFRQAARKGRELEVPLNALVGTPRDNQCLVQRKTVRKQQCTSINVKFITPSSQTTCRPQTPASLEVFAVHPLEQEFSRQPLAIATDADTRQTTCLVQPTFLVVAQTLLCPRRSAACYQAIRMRNFCQSVSVFNCVSRAQ